MKRLIPASDQNNIKHGESGSQKESRVPPVFIVICGRELDCYIPVWIGMAFILATLNNILAVYHCYIPVICISKEL